MNFIDILHFMNKTLRKEIMTRARLRSKFLKEKKVKKRKISIQNSNYFGNLKEKNINENYQ